MKLDFFATCLATVPSTPLTNINNMTLWELIRSADWVLLPLAALSFLIVGLIIFNLFWLRASSIVSDTFLSLSDRLLQDKNIEALIDLCSRTNETLPRILGKVILFARDNPGLDIEALNKIAEAEASHQVKRLNYPTQMIMDLGVMSPMVGLLGTVVGILRSFGSIASDATPMRTMLLAGGVSQALIATAIGLVLGLIAMFAYSYFRVRVQSLVSHFETNLTTALVKTYHRLAGR